MVGWKIYAHEMKKDILDDWQEIKKLGMGGVQTTWNGILSTYHNLPATPQLKLEWPEILSSIPKPLSDTPKESRLISQTQHQPVVEQQYRYNDYTSEPPHQTYVERQPTSHAKTIPSVSYADYSRTYQELFSQNITPAVKEKSYATNVVESLPILQNDPAPNITPNIISTYHHALRTFEPMTPVVYTPPVFQKRKWVYNIEQDLNMHPSKFYRVEEHPRIDFENMQVDSVDETIFQRPQPPQHPRESKRKLALHEQRDAIVEYGSRPQQTYVSKLKRNDYLLKSPSELTPQETQELRNELVAKNIYIRNNDELENTVSRYQTRKILRETGVLDYVFPEGYALVKNPAYEAAPTHPSEQRMNISPKRGSVVKTPPPPGLEMKKL